MTNQAEGQQRWEATPHKSGVWSVKRGVIEYGVWDEATALRLEGLLNSLIAELEQVKREREWALKERDVCRTLLDVPVGVSLEEAIRLHLGILESSTIQVAELQQRLEAAEERARYSNYWEEAATTRRAMYEEKYKELATTKEALRKAEAKAALVSTAAEILEYVRDRGADETLGEIKCYVGTHKSYIQNAASDWLARYDALTTAAKVADTKMGGVEAHRKADKYGDGFGN